MQVLGGNAISVQKVDCNYLVQLDGASGSPQTTMRFLCDWECIVNEDGSSTIVKKYATLTLPSAIVTEYTTECEDEDPYDPYDPYEPEEPDACGEEETTAELLSINCEWGTPYFEFRLLCLPSGAVEWDITITSSLDGPTHTVGGGLTDNQGSVIGHERYGSLKPGYAATTPGECFSFSIEWRDENGDEVRSHSLATDQCCADPPVDPPVEPPTDPPAPGDGGECDDLDTLSSEVGDFFCSAPDQPFDYFQFRINCRPPGANRLTIRAINITQGETHTFGWNAFHAIGTWTWAPLSAFTTAANGGDVFEIQFIWRYKPDDGPLEDIKTEVFSGNVCT
jgi:hypothetical protein